MSVQPILVMVAGPSGAGKTTLISGLVSRWPHLYARPVSYTSRPRRENEGDLEYQFVSREFIMEEFRRGNLANLDEVYGNLYAMSRASVDSVFDRGLSPIKEIHPSNHQKLRNTYKNIAAMIVLPGDQNQALADELVQNPRLEQDKKYYSGINLNHFEIVTRSCRSSGIEIFVEDAHWAIQAYIQAEGKFPSPIDIDNVNAVGYEKVAGHFVSEYRPTTANFHALSSDFFADAIRNIPPGANCLEIGPGQGWLRTTFPWPPVNYCALDVAAGMLSTLKEEPIANRTQAPARGIPFPSGQFDVVFASLGDGYCYPGAFAEIRRVLKRSGLLYFSAPSGIWAGGLRDAHSIDRTSFELPNGDKAEVYSFALPLFELQQLIGSNGYRVISAHELCGNRLPSGSNVSDALIKSARRLNVPLDSLPILNAIVAAKS